jgi:hypothetical protein
MSTIAGWIRVPVMAIALGTAGHAAGLAQGHTTQGERFASGGVGAGERAALGDRRDEFNFRMTTAAARTGAYLADVRVTILDEAGRLVLDVKLDGPWLFTQLKPGRYRVEATSGSEIRRRSTAIPEAGYREMFLYFDSGDAAPDVGKSGWGFNRVRQAITAERVLSAGRKLERVRG